MVTVGELRSGTRPIISEHEYAVFKGLKQTTVQKNRCKGKGIPFVKDPDTGRIGYRAEDVLAEFDRKQLYSSTAEYDTSARQERLAEARKARKKVGSGTASKKERR